MEKTFVFDEMVKLDNITPQLIREAREIAREREEKIFSFHGEGVLESLSPGLDVAFMRFADRTRLRYNPNCTDGFWLYKPPKKKTVQPMCPGHKNFFNTFLAPTRFGRAWM